MVPCFLGSPHPLCLIFRFLPLLALDRARSNVEFSFGLLQDIWMLRGGK